MKMRVEVSPIIEIDPMTLRPLLRLLIWMVKSIVGVMLPPASTVMLSLPSILFAAAPFGTLVVIETTYSAAIAICTLGSLMTAGQKVLDEVMVF